MLKSTFLRLAALSTIVGLCVTASVSASHSWGGYHWARQSNPVSLQIGDNLTGQWPDFLTTAEAGWEVSPVLNLTVVAGSSNRNCKPKAGRIEVCNAAYGFNGWLGIAQIWITGGVHITQATTKMNDSYFNSATYNTTAWKNLVMCQEVGHGFGLAHQDEDFDNANLNTCMDYTSSPSSNQFPNAHDYEELAIIYNHNDTSRRPAQHDYRLRCLRDGVDRSGQSPNWGQSVHRSQNGRQETFELDFGNGNKVCDRSVLGGSAGRRASALASVRLLPDRLTYFGAM
jgi:hypothetical protein